MVTLHIGFLICFFLLFFACGIITTLYLEKYFLLKSKEDLIKIEIVNEIQPALIEETSEIEETIKCDLKSSSPHNLKPKHVHRTSNVVKVPKVRIP